MTDTSVGDDPQAPGPTKLRRGPAVRRRVLRRLTYVIGAALLVVAIVVVGRTLAFTSRQIHATTTPSPVTMDGTTVAQHVGRAVSFQTVSSGGEAMPPDRGAFAGLHQFLAETYPLTHKVLSREVVGEASLLYTLPGGDPSLPPVLLLAHQDVVPAESPGAWTHDPFGGELAGGTVWGRGAVDCKGPLVGIFEAVEALLADGWRPRRTVLLAFGHDEEVGGRRGAAAIAALLESRGVRPAFVLDEGGCVAAAGMVPGVAKPVALVGVAEKGYLSLELTAAGEGGHSSMPPNQTAVGIVAAAVARLEADPFPATLSGVTRQTLAYLGPEMPFARRAALANLWLFAPLVERQYLAKPSTAAIVRTTTAATMIQGGVKDNVLPTEARAVINFRVLPGETTAGVAERVRRVVNDPRVRVAPVAESAADPSPVSPTDAPGFRIIQRTAAETFPDALVAPYLVLGATDARHYAKLSPCVYRFIPVRMDAQDLETIHGRDERLRVEDAAAMVNFYARLLKNADG